MPLSDRAFRALARAEPGVITGLLRAIAPETIGAETSITPDDVATSHLDPPPPPIDADWVARLGAGDVVHVECQGYRDTTFAERLFRYHLQLVLRHQNRTVRSVAIWLTPPPDAQRVAIYERGDVTIRIRTVILAQVAAAVLLEDPATACFAPGADPGNWSVAVLCDRTARVLARAGATHYQRHMAVVAAATRNRYETMVKAMSDHNIEPVIIEDLVKFGEDRGLEAGRAEGLEAGRAEGVALVVRQVERKLGRILSAREHETLAARLQSLGPARVGDVVLDFDGERLANWLADVSAR